MRKADKEEIERCRKSVSLSKNDKVICDSLQVAERFEKRHDVVIRSIENLCKNMEHETAKLWFQKTMYKSPDNNKSYPMYYMNRDGFSLLVMGFTGKQALDWKIKYIKAFNQMESLLREKTTQTWEETRRTGKLTRQAETDIIKKLVEYAKEQGSTHADMLYMTYSKLANKMAGISNRDLATCQQLNELSFVEHIILNQILIGMDQGLPYKEIYKLCKARIEQFREVAYLTAVVKELEKRKIPGN